jgi:16S rRNA (guanine527-N7)-methyltransferase
MHRFGAFLKANYNRTRVTPDRIDELLAPFLGGSYLSPPRSAAADRLLGCISTYIDILLRWNSRINLTAVRDPEEIVTRHFGESLFAAHHVFSGSDEDLARSAAGRIRVADVGSGAGFPGIPFKLLRPDISLTLIESNHKKATFLREAGRSLELTDFDVCNVRAQDLPEDQIFDIVTLRAVERFEEVLPVAARPVASGGCLALLIGGAQVESASSLGERFLWQSPVRIPQSRSRILLLGRKQR